MALYWPEHEAGYYTDFYKFHYQFSYCNDRCKNGCFPHTKSNLDKRAKMVNMPIFLEQHGIIMERDIYLPVEEESTLIALCENT